MQSSAKLAAQAMVLRSFAIFGLRLQWIAPLDMRGTTDHPIDASYLAAGRPFLLEVPLDRCRGLEGIEFGLGPQSVHPFVRTLQEYARCLCPNFEGSPLARYYEYFQPASAAHALGLDQHSALAAHPPLALVLPWTPTSPPRRQEQRRRIIVREACEHGSNTSADEGWKTFGPVTQKMGTVEMKRLTQVFDSIRNLGYRRDDRDDGDITGVILLDDHDWALTIIGHGQHRIAALAALGYARAPIRIGPHSWNSIIRRREVDHWPHVRDGLFTRDEALLVFDRILEGRAHHEAIPPEWRKVVSKPPLAGFSANSK